MNDKNKKVEKRRVAVLGISGMLGSVVFQVLNMSNDLDVIGVSRTKINSIFNNKDYNVIYGVDVENDHHLLNLFSGLDPDVVINCIGVIKQHDDLREPLVAISINSLFPHKLSKICNLIGARLVHISTDCVFSGEKGMYREEDIPDAMDLYGRTKLLGEIYNNSSITIRTSIIGHELSSKKSLIEWFLSQKGAVRGYVNAIFSGLPTVEVAEVIRDYIIPNDSLTGLYHLSSDPISKYELLKLVSSVYEKKVTIIPDSSLRLDRSLDSTRFRKKTGYFPMSWHDLVVKMYEHRLESKLYG